jgi:cobalt/nickel transport system ATP-binding protein
MTPILEVEGLCYRYPGQAATALLGASMSLPPGQKVAVVGRNGSGKSTLFLHCNGILRPASGVVRFDGRPIAYDRKSLLDLRRRVGIVFQDPEDQLFSASVAQDISFGPLNLGLDTAEVARRVRAAAEMCEMLDLLDRPTHAMSGGQKTRAALAGVLAMDPEVILVDEVTGSLDPWMRRQILGIFEKLVASGKTVVMATHDVNIARRWADVIVVMDAGKVLATDTPETVFADRSLVELICPDAAW